MITYEEGVKLVYLAFRLWLIYRVIYFAMCFAFKIPDIVEKAKIRKIKAEVNHAKSVEAYEGLKKATQSYKATRIGFSTTMPIIDRNES